MDIKPTFTLLSELDGDKPKMIEYCQNWGLLPHQGTYMCPRCGNSLKLQVSSRSVDGYHWVCGHKLHTKAKKVTQCTCRVALRTNTFFEKSQLSLKNIVAFSSMWVQSYKQQQIMWQLDLATQTVADWGSFCREVAYKAMIQNGEPIGGEGKIVEIDESKFTNRNCKRGRVPSENWVIGGYERGSGRIFMVPVEDRSCETLLRIIKRWILPGTKIISDCWRAYDNLRNEGYQHENVNNTLNFMNVAKISISPANRKQIDRPVNLARYLLNKKAKAIGRDPSVYFLELAGTLYNPLVDRQEEEVEQQNEHENEAEDECEDESDNSDDVV